MQTFLPWPDFKMSAEALDRQRLGKQRVETLQILRALTDEKYGWQHHPATRMWRGYEVALVNYGIAICEEWISRGYRDTCLEKIDDMRNEITNYRYRCSSPDWLGWSDFHETHRAMLYRKDPMFYAKFLGTFNPNVEDYIWPKGIENHEDFFMLPEPD
jgi:hypothetical protein